MGRVVNMSAVVDSGRKVETPSFDLRHSSGSNKLGSLFLLFKHCNLNALGLSVLQ